MLNYYPNVNANQKPKRIYLYPISSRGEDISANPYISNLAKAIKELGEIVNLNQPSSSGIFQMILYYRKYNVLFLNWIENIPDRKAGYGQSLLLFALIIILRLSGKKIIWVMHNKVSHSKTNFWIKKILFRYLLRYSHLVITHSSEGVRYANTVLKKITSNIHYIPHPFDISCSSYRINKTPKYDFLIWGSMVSYKAVDVFLTYLKDSGKADDFRILVIGRFSSESYLEKVKSLAGKRTEIVNQFATKDELKELISLSVFVLFTYHDNSVLSSGALMDTICFGGDVIGPDIGAFADLADEKLILNYKDYSEIPQLLKLKSETYAQEVSTIREKYINSNGWDGLSTKIQHLL